MQKRNKKSVKKAVKSDDLFGLRLILLFVLILLLVVGGVWFYNYDEGVLLSSEESNSPFGVIPAWIISDQSVRDFSFAKDLGISSTGANAVWRNIEGIRGSYNWSGSVPFALNNGFLDEEVLNAQSNNISINEITISTSLPSWARCRNVSCPSANYPYADCLYDLQYTQEFKNYVSALVERYDGDGINDAPGLKDGINYWRVGTELGDSTFWCGNSSDFLTLFDDSYSAIKSADNNANIIVGGLNDARIGCISNRSYLSWCATQLPALDMIDSIYTNINKSRVDALGIHPYYKIGDLAERLDLFKSYILTKGFVNIPIWAIEDGEVLPNEIINSVSDKRQAEEVVKRFVISMSRNISHFNWFDLYWYHDTSITNYNNMALLEYNQSSQTYMKRPGFYTYQLMVEKLNGYSSVEVLSENLSTYYGYKFIVGGKPVWVLWTNLSIYNLNLDTSGKNVSVTNIVTNRSVIVPAVENNIQSGGVVSINLTPTPIFVQEASLVSINGACSQINVSCDSGMFVYGAANLTHHYWLCLGINGGANASCSLLRLLSRLNIDNIGTGSGVITSNPSGINCGATCSYDFANDSYITLTAVNSTGSNFSSWQGCSDISVGHREICYVNLNSNKTILTNFTLLPGYTDEDEDGVVDIIDQCNNTSSGLNNSVNVYGCPMPIATKFDIKPDFNNANLTNISSFEIGISDYGKIYYLNRVISLLKSNGGDRYNLDLGINITEGKVFLNSSILPTLNVSARITLYDIEFNSPKILLDGSNCTSCNIISYDGSTIVFNVSHFTIYEVVDADPSVCGNGVIEAGELCDLTNVTSSCTARGYAGGTLRCNSNCGGYNVSGCTSSVGNNNAGGDDNDGANTDTCTSNCAFGDRECFDAGYRLCGNFDSDSCYEWGSVTACNSTQECRSGVCVAKSTPRAPTNNNQNTKECDQACKDRNKLILAITIGIIGFLIFIIIVILIVFVLKKRRLAKLQNQSYQMGNNNPYQNYPSNV